MFASSFFLFFFLLFSTLANEAAGVRDLPKMAPEKDGTPIAGGNAVSIPGGDDTLAASMMSLDGRGHFTLTNNYNPIAGNAVSIRGSRSHIPSGGDHNTPIAGSPGGNTVSIRGSTASRGGDYMLVARWSPSPPPSKFVLESEPPSKPRPPTCLPKCF